MIIISSLNRAFQAVVDAVEFFLGERDYDPKSDPKVVLPPAQTSPAIDLEQ